MMIIIFIIGILIGMTCNMICGSKKLKIKFRIAPDNTCYGFGVFLRPPKKAIDKEPLILINFQAHLFTSLLDEEIEFYDLIAESTVHEMLHQIQYIYKRQFREREVNQAIEQAKRYMEKDKIVVEKRGNKKRKEEYEKNLAKRKNEKI